jgi:hypothetical protein
VIIKPSHYRSDDERDIGSDEKDPFGHRDYAGTIVDALPYFPRKFTLGLFGAWGSGKSTILKEVGRRLKAEKEQETAFVLFDAWRYEGDSLRREFIRSVGQSLKSQKALQKGFDLDEHVRSFDVDQTTVSRSRLRINRATIRDGAVAAVIVGLVVGGLLLLLTTLDLSQSTALKLFTACASALTAFVLVALQRLLTPDPIQATERRLEFPDQFAANFKELLHKVEARRLVIAIDNLDRCSPARVTEILTTVKTFLEPAFDERSVPSHGWLKSFGKRAAAKFREPREQRLEHMCFVIAADDSALRRHLAAQEMSRSSKATSSAEPSSNLPIEVLDAVNEYLRKFFGASIRIREVLDEDIRQFTTEELQEFVTSREDIDSDIARELVEITSQGLKHNPRRIKQFVNNLKLRLAMMAERKKQQRIHIDPDVLVVAKLAVIEEEFPQDFERLQRNPSLLRRWHSIARNPDSGDDEDGHSEGESLDSALASFLRFTDDLQPRSIRAYLDLKQTKHELNMPRYTEFVDLLDGGDIEKLQDLLGEEAGEIEAFAEAARSHFEQQKRAKAWGRAHNTLRSIVEIAPLRGEGGKVALQTLGETLARPELKERLIQLNPDTLLGVSVEFGLSEGKLSAMIEEMISGLGSESDSDTRVGITTALAKHADIVDIARREQIRSTLNDGAVVGDFDSYALLAEAMPDAIVDDTAASAVARLEELGVESVSTSHSAFRVAVSRLALSPVAELVERLLVLVQSALNHYRDGGNEEYGRVAERLVEVIDGAEETSAMIQLSGDPGNSRWAAVDLGTALCRTSASADSGSGNALGRRLFSFSDGDAIVGWLQKHFKTLPPGVRSGVSDSLAEALSGASEIAESELAAIKKLFPESEQTALVRRAVDLAIDARRPAVASSLIERLEVSEREEIISRTLMQIAEDPFSQVARAEFVIAERTAVGEERLLEVGRHLARAIHETRDLTAELAPLIGQLSFKDTKLRLQLVEDLLATEGDMGDEARRQAMLQAAWNVAGKGNSNARKAVNDRLKEIRDTTSGPVADFARQLLGEG